MYAFSPRCAIRASVNTLDEVQAAMAAGIEGIGLYRTESMLTAPDRLQALLAVIVPTGAEDRVRAMEALLPLHQRDFERLFRIASPLPITIRLLDPPLQGLLPSSQQLESDLASAHADENWDAYVVLETIRGQFLSLNQKNPSMGHRGCRLSLTNPELLRLQVRAILQAAVTVSCQGFAPLPEIMVPLVASEEEMRVVVDLIRETASAVFVRFGREVPYRIGALIELPRAALCAAGIAEHADFISFGTNDLTQMTFGFSKEDARRYMGEYLKQAIFAQDPFISIDREGVGHLIELAIRDIREVNPEAAIGICGDHTSDPESIRFFSFLGVDHISCPPESIGEVRRWLAAAEECILLPEYRTSLVDTPKPGLVVERSTGPKMIYERELLICRL